MESIYKLSFPYYQQQPHQLKDDQLSITLNKLALIAEDDSIRYIINLNNENKFIESIDQTGLSDKSTPVQYVQNLNPTQCGKFPLLLKVNPWLNKLKFHIQLKLPASNKEFKNKSLIIIKSSKDIEFVKSSIESKQFPKDLEISKIEFENLPIDKDSDSFQKIIINDSYGSTLFNNNNLNISIWEHDNDSYQYLLDFSLFVDKIEVSQDLHIEREDMKTDQERPFTIGDFKEVFNFNIKDGPELRKSFKDLEAKIPTVRKIYLQLIDDFKVLESNLRRINSTKLKILDSVNSLLVDNENNHLLNEMKFKQLFKDSFLKLFENFDMNMKLFLNNVCDSKCLIKILNHISSSEQNTAASSGHSGQNTLSNELDWNSNLNKKKQQFENDSKEYYSWLNKYLSNEKERPESKLLTKRKTFELSKFDYLNQLSKYSNNQYLNELVENLFKFIASTYDQNGLSNISLIKNNHPSFDSNFQIYLNVLSKFNSEKSKFRQMIEACQTNEELTNLINNNKLNNSTSTSTINDFIITNENFDLLFSTEEVISNSQPQKIINDESGISGILFKLGGQKKQGWHKEWVVVKNGQLVEYSDWRKGKTPINKPIEISLSSIKPITHDKRQFCFEITTSANSKHVFQAINSDDRNNWLKALYNAGQLVNTERIEKQLHNNPKKLGKLTTNFEKPSAPAANNNIFLDQDRSISPISIKSKLPTPIEQEKDKNYFVLVKNLPNCDNNICLDCGTSEQVEWVSLNTLSCFCINCSSCHRNLSGSRVRSLKLDKFENESELLLKYINNVLVNKVLEHNLMNSEKIKPNESNDSRLNFIKNKYLSRKYVEKIPDVNNKLIKSIQSIDVGNVLKCILAGGDVNLTIQISSSNINNQVVDLFEYSLRKYVEIEKNGESDKLFIISELLILNGCRIKDPVLANKELDLTKEAMSYWKYRYLKLSGIH